MKRTWVLQVVPTDHEWMNRADRLNTRQTIYFETCEAAQKMANSLDLRKVTYSIYQTNKGKE